MKEEKITLISKKIRNKLIYYTYLELKRKPSDNNSLLINSMTPNELNDKYQKCSDYCVEKIETYTSNHNGIDNNNYFHVSLTYCSLNNNYHMIVDNKNVDQYIGHNNIVGKYYKGNKIQIGTTTDKIKYNICLNQNKLEKNVIGAKKLIKERKCMCSSLEVTKNIIIMDNVKNNEINAHLDNLKSNDNSQNMKKLIKDNINNGKVQSNLGNKIRKTNTQKIINKYMLKLKKYCANLIIIERKGRYKKSVQNNNKLMEPSSSTNDKKRKNKNDKNVLKNGKDKPKVEDQQLILNPLENSTINQNFINMNFEFRNLPIHKKLKSQTKIFQNLFKIQVKKSFKKHKSIDKSEEDDYKKRSQKKVNSLKKFSSSKKGSSPKKVNINELNSGPIFSTSKFFNVIQKNNKKEKPSDLIIKKFVSGDKIDINSNRRKGILNINDFPKLININNNINYERGINNTIKVNNNNNHKVFAIKSKFKKALTINKMFKFKSRQILEKKINNVRIKENNKQ